VRTPPRRGSGGGPSSVGPIIVLTAALIMGVAVVSGRASASGPSRNDRSPVNLATPVDLSRGRAHPSAVVRVGGARIEVLSPTLLRLEYSPSGHFEDRPTVNVVDRRLPVPVFRTHRSAGWLIVRTSAATLRYKIGSGAFTAANTSVRFAVGNRMTTVHPTWEWECPFDQTCQAGAAVLMGGAALSQGQSGYRSSAGYVGYLLKPGAGATWHVLSVPGGTAVLSLRYSNVVGPPQSPGPRTVDLVVNGHRQQTLVAAPTSSGAPWSTITTTATLRAGTNAVAVVCSVDTSCNIGVDSLSVGPSPAAAVPATLPPHPLGGWIRGFDTATYAPGPTCAPGTAGATCQTALEPLHTDGLLDSAGWRVLDDTGSAQWTTAGWVEPRPAGSDVEDGYLFTYGHRYTEALRTFAQLTGAAPLLPRRLFGVWYSDYTPYSSATIEDSIYPAFRSNDVPLDTLSLDTDWKAPNNWDGWEWNDTLFPDPTAFLQWARTHGIAVTLNLHSSIDDKDPQLPATEALAGGALASSDCSAGPCQVWDWSSMAQAESNFALQQPLEKQGVAFWWLDWCCDASVVSMPGLTPDAWIGHLYAQEMVNRGQRGFVLARVGASNDEPEEVYPAGPWSDHTSAIAFTGDAWGTWDTLARQAALTPDEATIGEPYVSDDIGSFLGPPPRGTQDPADLYDRWVQLGTFQPILRLHSDDEQRLPWQYPQPVRAITATFLRLRADLIPYTYTLAARAHDRGQPMAAPLYLDYPDQRAAYLHSGEFLFGPDMLVAPVTSPGAVAHTTVWFPPGRWVDYFTGATFTGPLTTTVTDPLSRMPVFIRAGGIIPEQAPSSPASGTDTHPLIVKVFAGSGGSFHLYNDSGTGLGYTSGQSTDTLITDSLERLGTAGATATDHVSIGPGRGHYPGEPTTARYRVELVDVTRPTTVTVDGRPLPRRSAAATAPGWSYSAATATLSVTTTAQPTTTAVRVAATGVRVVPRAEPSTS
jgi:hypothetical protein